MSEKVNICSCCGCEMEMGYLSGQFIAWEKTNLKVASFRHCWYD